MVTQYRDRIAGGTDLSAPMTTTTSRFDRGARHRDDRRRAGNTVYPALGAWWKRVGDTPPSRWTLDNLWRAAMAEVEASENRKHPERERLLQREAIALVLGLDKSRVQLTVEVQQEYEQRVREFAHGRAAP